MGEHKSYYLTGRTPEITIAIDLMSNRMHMLLLTGIIDKENPGMRQPF